MKKHDEGYALPMVLVVITILCLVSAYILSGAEQTVTAQQNSIAQMKQEYAEQGKIEVIVSQLNGVGSETALKNLCGTIVQLSLPELEDRVDDNTLTITISTKDPDDPNQKVWAECDLLLKGTGFSGDNWSISSAEYVGYRIGGATE